MLSKISYQKKIYILCILTAVLIMTASGIAFYFYTKNIMQSEMISNTEESLGIVVSQIEYSYAHLDDVTKRLQTSSVMQNITRHLPDNKNNDFETNAKLHKQLNSLFLEYIIGENLDTSIHFVNHQGDSTSTFLNIYPYSEKTFTYEEIGDCYNELAELIGNQYSISREPHEDIWTTGGRIVFSVARAIRDNFCIYGYVEICVDVERFYEMLHISDMEDPYQIYVYNDNQLLFSTSGAVDNDQRIAEEKLLNGDGRIYYSEHGKLWIRNDSEKMGWHAVICRDAKGIAHSLNVLKRTIIAAYSIILAVLMAALFFLTRNMVKPLKQLQIKLMSLTDADHNEMLTDNEVDALAGSIENLVDTIRKNDHTLEVAKRQAILAHITSLEAQLNPHFLYNTLSVIGYIGLENNQTDIYEMCSTLADLLRYSIKYESKVVDLKMELDNVTKYLFIMQKRYEDGLHVEIDLDERINNCPVPKLCFQPVVENAFEHGFKKQIPPLNLHIRTETDGRNWYFIVKNNGARFDEKMIDNLRVQAACIGEEMVKPSGFGLGNTLKRLYFLYGEDYIFDVKNEEDGVSVVIGGTINGPSDQSNCSRK